ncbi:unnamed protein product [marine sediment metagenome]|uniref:Uncharacterized protein n=1 Tax=marine sediment metagenome TaxID=412755 RepID=X0U5A6_9ZZZZ
MNDNTIKAGIAMVCVTILEVYALSKGINGTGLSVAIAVLAGLGGYAYGRANRV